MASDIFDPINEGLKAIRDVYTTRRKLDIEDTKDRLERAEKKEKKAKEAKKEEAREKLLNYVRTNPDAFEYPDLAAAAVEAGGSPAAYMRPKDRPISYPVGGSGYGSNPMRAGLSEDSAGGMDALEQPDAMAEEAGPLGEDIRKQVSDVSYNRGLSSQNIQNIKGRLYGDALKVSEALVQGKAKGSQDLSGLNAQQAGYTGQMRILDRAQATLSLQNQNYQKAIKVFNDSEEGQQELQSLQKTWDKEYAPLLRSMGLDEGTIESRFQDVAQNQAEGFKLGLTGLSSQLDSIKRAFDERGEIDMAKLDDPDTKRLLQAASEADLPTLKKMAANAEKAGLTPYQKDLLAQQLQLKFIQEGASNFVMKTTGEAIAFPGMTSEDIENIFKPFSNAIDDLRLQAPPPSEVIRSKVEQDKKEAEIKKAKEEEEQLGSKYKRKR